MIELNPKINLWSHETPALNPEKNFTPYLTPVLLDDDQIHDAMVILPGGGYGMKCNDHEGIQIAQVFNALGFNCFIVDYRCGAGAYPYPAPQQDAIRAIKMIRGNAEKWHIRPDHIAAVGFSAGGHLCASLAVWNSTIEANNGDEFDAISGRPDAVILSYAVTASRHGHVGSFKNLLNKPEPSEEESAKLACDTAVTPDAPPAFIWCTATDQVVPMMNSVSYALACKQNNVPFSLHVFPLGHHGLGTGLHNEFLDVRAWPSLAKDFLNMVWK